MNTYRKGVITFISLLIIAATIVTVMFGCSEELASKPEWSVLQSIELENRHRRFTEPEIITIDGYPVLGVQGNNGQRIWILLNSNASPFYKQVPQGSFSISSNVINQVRAIGTASETVIECLGSHLDVPESLSR